MRYMVMILFLIGLLRLAFALPAKVYLPVPFLCQAPFGNWNQPWQDACEEAAIVMAMAFAKGDPTRLPAGQVTRESGNQEMLRLIEFQKKKYGGHFDLTAQQIAQLIKDYYRYDKVEVRYDIRGSDIKEELAKGSVVIAPMAGKLLGNPYFTPPGPDYHNIVFKGYDDQAGEFIANDPGTRRGRNYRYQYQIAYQAIHDWTGNKKTIAQGRKAVIILQKAL